MKNISENSSKAVIEIRVDVPRSDIDPVSDFIIEHICHGLVLEDTENSATVGIIFYVSPDEENQAKQQLTNYLDSITKKTDYFFTSRPVHKSDWEEQYRKSVQPVKVGNDIVIRPPWAEPEKDIPYDIVIEPKMAFGTGRHETTSSCLSVIRKSFTKKMSFLDVGCGSGILSIMADKLQAGFIKAVDYDITAVENCRENFVMNNVTAPYEIIHGTVEKCDGDKPYDFVCANIIKSTILEILPQLLSLTKTNSALLLSGLLDKDMDEIETALRKQGYDSFTVVPENEWRSFVVKKG